MTAPANKKRTHNAAARAASQNIAGGGAERVHRTRQSPYARRLEALKMAAAIKEQMSMRDAPATGDGAATDDVPTMADAPTLEGEEE